MPLTVPHWLQRPRPNVLGILARISLWSGLLGTAAMPRVVRMHEISTELVASKRPAANGSEPEPMPPSTSRRRRRTLAAHSLDVNESLAFPALDDAGSMRPDLVSAVARASVAEGSRAAGGGANLEALNHSANINASKSHRFPRRKGISASALIGDPSDDWQERAGTFGVVPLGLLLELHLHGVTLKQLHRSTKSSLAEFLLAVHSEFSQDLERLNILGIHERYRQEKHGSLAQTDSDQEVPVRRVNQEVVVRFEAIPDQKAGRMPEQVVQTLAARLADPSSPLLAEPFAFAFKNASLSESAVPDLAATPVDMHSDPKALGAMALPIGVSAVFTGILLWTGAC